MSAAKPITGGGFGFRLGRRRKNVQRSDIGSRKLTATSVDGPGLPTVGLITGGGIFPDELSNSPTVATARELISHINECSGNTCSGVDYRRFIIHWRSLSLEFFIFYFSTLYQQFQITIFTGLALELQDSIWAPQSQQSNTTWPKVLDNFSKMTELQSNRTAHWQSTFLEDYKRNRCLKW